jgi:DNA-directed RNA polymerase specialized sigma24 family protein
VKFAIRDLSKYGDISNKITDKTFFAYDHEKIEILIVTLPNEDRIIFVLHDLEGYTYEEIKNFLEDQSPDEIKSKLLAIREQLMTKMKL